jgi:superfamily II DNA or RNA helicase
MSSFNLDTIPWEKTRVVQTKHGARRVREWTIPKGSPFWKLWHTRNLKQQGYTVSKWKDAWVLTEWRLPKGDQLLDALHANQAATVADAVQNRMEQAEPELPDYLAANFGIVEGIYASILAETGQDYSYQLPSIKRLALALEAYDSALDASDTGTGKTFVACGVARVLNRALFVVCPKNVLPPWRRAAELFGVEIEVINYEMLRTGNSEWGWWVPAGRGRAFQYDGIDSNETVFVFDECHRMKDYRTLNCQLGLAALDERFKTLGLSATAADNPLHMKFVALLTGLIRHPAHYYGWMSQNGVRKGKWGLEFVGGRDVLSRIHRQIFPLRGTRIRIADLGDRFPQTQIISEAYGMDNAAEIQAIYDEMHAEIAKLEATKAEDRSTNTLTVQLRARQQVELLKVPTLVQMVEDGLAEDMSVVVVLNFDDSIKALTQRLKTSNTITGADKPEVRQAVIDAFNADDEQLLVMNIKAGGLGISLHGTPTSRTRLVLISPTFSGIDLKQALGRCHRAGGAHSIQKIVWAAGTIEEHACKKVRARMQRVSIFNDDQLDAALVI